MYNTLNMENTLHKKLPSQSGALKFNIPQYMLENLLAEGFTIKEISAIICVADMHTGK